MCEKNEVRSLDKERYYFGFDVALRKSGIVITDKDENIVFQEILTVPSKYNLTDSVKIIYDKLIEVYKSLPKEALVITIVEDVLGVVHIRSALAIHAARTAAILAWHHSHQTHKEIHYYTPNDVKYFLLGKRTGKKDEVKLVFEDKFPQYGTLQEDIIDALLLVKTHLNPPEKKTKVKK